MRSVQEHDKNEKNRLKEYIYKKEKLPIRRKSKVNFSGIV